MSVIPTINKERVYKQLKGASKQDWDIIVIGSGMASMSCAAALSMMGNKVLVLEKHYIPGGMTHMFKRGKYSWDVGVHALGEMGKKKQIGKLLSWLTNSQIKMNFLNDPYDRFFWPDFEIGFPTKSQKFIKVLKERFPQEQTKIDQYFNLCHKVSKDAKLFFALKSLPKKIHISINAILKLVKKDYWETTTKEALDGIGISQKLQAVLTAQWGYYGSLPKRSSFAIHALTSVHFWGGGAYYPIGGAKEIAAKILNIVNINGGEVLCNAEVQEVLIKKNKAYGVKMVTGEEFHARKIISGASAQISVSNFLPQSYQNKDWVKSIMKLNTSPPYICLYMGFKGDIAKAKATSTNWWFNKNFDVTQENWDFENEKSADILYVSFPSLKDPTYDPGEEQLHTGECVTFMPWELFEKWQNTDFKNRDEEYKKIKAEIQESIINQLKSHMPDIMQYLDFAELSTPLTTNHFCNTIKGAIYGLEATPERFTCTDLRPKTPIKNFYLTGIDTAAPGVVGAMSSGVLTAANIHPNLYLKMI